MRPWNTMTGAHVEMCLSHANQVDPLHGPQWDKAFEAKAGLLGYASSDGPHGQDHAVGAKDGGPTELEV